MTSVKNNSGDHKIFTSTGSSTRGTNLSISGTSPPAILADFLGGKIIFSFFSEAKPTNISVTMLQPANHTILNK